MTTARDADQSYEISREHKGLSLFDYLDAVVGPLDRKRVAAAAHEKQIRVNGEAAVPGVTLRAGDLVEVSVPTEALLRTQAPLQAVLHSDDALVVAAKPSGVAFGEGRRGGVSALGALASQFPGARPLHRLDKQTSGVVVAARNRASESVLSEEIQAGRAWVEYTAVVRGTPDEAEGRVDVPLGKRRKADVRLVPDPDHGTPCATRWRVVERLRGFSVLELVPESGGRSHQVRAHLAVLGHPALCDRLYGEDDRILLSQLKLEYRPKRGRPERPILARPALHAGCFVRGALEVRAELPADLGVLLAQLRRLRPLG
ncbi:MAG: RluA family pseudouridine synthase [Planctomycetota bacterium]|jgi:23S rRNA pseudouridine1911/1915/1917 synthase